MGENLLNGVITVKEVGLEDKRLKITDLSGKVYSIWRTKQDGTETVAFKFFSPIALQAQGKTFEIGYDEKENPKSQGTYFRSIKFIKNGDELSKAKQDGVKQSPQLSAIVDRIIKLENAVFGEVKPITKQEVMKKEITVDEIPF